MDWRFKPCTTATGKMDMDMDSCTTTTWPLIDRLSSLPDELLIRILSLLPTKDAAATCVLSKRLRRVFPFIMSLDFDVSPISHCATHPYKIQQFPCFVNFVDTVLSSYQSQYLTKFRLRVSTDFNTTHFRGCFTGSCKNECSPEFTSNQIQSWISFPFTRRGLKELELCIYTRVSGSCQGTCCIASDAQLPPAIFMCESLETLKLDINLDLHHVYTMSSFRLPNLKRLHLRASIISEDGDGFVSRLVSSCPILEDLVMEAFWNDLDCLRICSSSLRRLIFRVFYGFDETWNTGSVVINTPKLEDLEYFDQTASNRYSIINLDCVAKAGIGIDDPLKVLCFIRALSNVKHLYLNGCLNEDFNSVVDQLPVFRNLKYLHLGFDGYVYWDIMLLAFLNRSPVLETLAFLEGLVDADGRNSYSEALELEQEFFRTAQVTTLECCKSHLKRIEIHYYFGDRREIDLIRFLLRHALVLEELIVSPLRIPSCETPDQKSMESTLRNLPKASINCSIQVLG